MKMAPMARRDSVGIRLITRRGNDWSARFPLIVEAVKHLKVRSCLIDGEVVCCDAQGMTSFQLHRRNEPQAFLYAFDLLELNGTDLRREPIEVRKATLASILPKSRHGVRLNEHLEHPEGHVVFQHACKMGLEGGANCEAVGQFTFFALPFRITCRPTRKLSLMCGLVRGRMTRNLLNASRPRAVIETVASQRFISAKFRISALSSV
jgi:ATP dependent DNA ligase domain